MVQPFDFWVTVQLLEPNSCDQIGPRSFMIFRGNSWESVEKNSCDQVTGVFLCLFIKKLLWPNWSREIEIFLESFFMNMWFFWKTPVTGHRSFFMNMWFFWKTPVNCPRSFVGKLDFLGKLLWTVPGVLWENWIFWENSCDYL